MDSKAKVLNALNHKNGKVPFDMGSAPTSGIHAKPLEALRKHYQLDEKPIEIIEPYQMLGRIDDDLRQVLGIDTQPFWNPNTMFGYFAENFKPWETPWGQTVMMAENFVTREQDGNTYVYAGGDTDYEPCAVMPKGSGFFDATNRQKNFDENNLNLADNLEEFGAVDDKTLQFFKDNREQVLSSPYAALGNLGSTAIGDIALVPGIMLKQPKGIRDITEWYMSTMLRPDYLHQIFDYQTTVAIENLEKMHAVLGDAIQLAYICGNDFGTQKAPFCSPNTFDSLYMPYYKRINGWIHENTNWKTFKHSCGSIEPLIPSMIESGFDVLNPVQWSADGMDRKMLKEKYGDDIVFWGGGVNTQTTLPFGTPQEVRKEVLDCCEIFSKDGGFVFNTIHNITADVPIENIVAMVEALKEFNGEK
jgi:hypothetical protein